MPIIRINKDGTVRIARKSGADPIDVKPEDLANYNPTLVKDYVDFLDAQKNLEAGGSGASTIAERKVESTQSVLDNLSTLYYGKEGEKSLALTEEGAFRLPGQLKGLEAKIKSGKADSIEKRIYEYNRLKQSKMAFLAKAYGDTGNIAYQEQLNAIQSLPDTGTTPGEALTLWDTAYSSTGTKPSNRIENEFKKNNYQRQSDIANETINTTAGGGNQPPQAPPQSQLQQILQAGKQAIPTNPQQAMGAGKNVLQELFKVAAKGAMPTISSAVDITRSPAGRFISPTTNQAFDRLLQGNPIPDPKQLPGIGLEALGLLGGGFGAAKLAPKIATKLFPFSTGTKLRPELIKKATEAGKEVDLSPILGKIDKWATIAKKANPTEAKRVDEFVEGAKKLYKGKVKVPEAISIREEANAGWTSAQKVGKTLEGSFQRFIRDNLDEGIEKTAPGFKKASEMIGKGYKVTKPEDPIKRILKKGAGFATGAASGALIGGYLYNKLLNR